MRALLQPPYRERTLRLWLVFGLSAMTLYEKSQVDLDRATGLLLDHEGIDINDALRGQVTHLPTVPYVTANPAALTPPPSQ